MSFASEYWVPNLILFVVGLVVLVKGSGWFIDGAAFIAHHLRVPDMIVGLTLVSIGTSLPELATNCYAAATGDVGVAMGNVVGSNIANVLLVLGVAAVAMGTIPTDRTLYGRDTMVMVVAFGVFAVLAYLGLSLERWEGAVLLLGCAAYIVYLVTSKGGVEREAEVGSEEAGNWVKSIAQAWGLLVLGIVMVVGGAKCMVDNVVWMANELKAPQEIVSATLVALGTSAPELAVTLAGIAKNKNDIAMGNIIGSNTFNLLLVMGATALIHPVGLVADVQMVVLPVMIVTGLVLLLFMRTGWALDRWEGIVFLLGYGSFIGYSVYQCLARIALQPAG